MGRELKRVPLDFEWPLDKVWVGFLNPHYTATECRHCVGTGSSPIARRLKGRWYGNARIAPFRPQDRGSEPHQPTHPAIQSHAEWNIKNSPEFYGIGEAAIAREAIRLAAHFNRGWSHHLNADDVAALVDGGRLMDLTHTWSQGEGWKRKEPAYLPTPQEVNDWSMRCMGHDSINQWIVVGAECERLGEPSTCAHCEGEGVLWPSAEDKARHEAWSSVEPPKGDGLQIWETVSEGSPISPVFATAEELARHMAGTRWGADQGTTYEQWLEFINGPGWAPSMICDANGLRTGVQAA